MVSVRDMIYSAMWYSNIPVYTTIDYPQLSPAICQLFNDTRRKASVDASNNVVRQA